MASATPVAGYQPNNAAAASTATTGSRRRSATVRTAAPATSAPTDGTLHEAGPQATVTYRVAVKVTAPANASRASSRPSATTRVAAPVRDPLMSGDTYRATTWFRPVSSAPARGS